VVKCHLCLADPPYGITQEAWEPQDLEAFTRDWSSRWAQCGADFIAVFWSQKWLFAGREWLDESLSNYRKTRGSRGMGIAPDGPGWHWRAEWE